MNTTISEYEQSAIDFLKNTNTSISFKFKEHAPYFPDEIVSRDIWYVTLRNEKHFYKFTFGQSFVSEGKTPTPYDVLACIEKRNPGSLQDFCSEFGYNIDSKKDEKVYKACVNEWQNIRTLFTPEEIEKLQEIQ